MTRALRTRRRRPRRSRRRRPCGRRGPPRRAPCRRTWLSHADRSKRPSGLRDEARVGRLYGRRREEEEGAGRPAHLERAQSLDGWPLADAPPGPQTREARLCLSRKSSLLLVTGPRWLVHASDLSVLVRRPSRGPTGGRRPTLTQSASAEGRPARARASTDGWTRAPRAQAAGQQQAASTSSPLCPPQPPSRRLPIRP